MSTAFSDVEVQFLTSGVKALARIATVGKDGLPHVVPTGWTYNAELDTLDVTGRDVELTKISRRPAQPSGRRGDRRRRQSGRLVAVGG